MAYSSMLLHSLSSVSVRNSDLSLFMHYSSFVLKLCFVLRLTDGSLKLFVC